MRAVKIIILCAAVAFLAIYTAEPVPVVVEAAASPTPFIYDTAPLVTRTPFPTPTPKPPEKAHVAEFAALLAESGYAFICEVTGDLGFVNVAEGMSQLAPGAYMGERQYTLRIIEVIKAERPDQTPEEGAEILFSIPFSYKIAPKSPEMPQNGYFTLEEGLTFLLFAEYNFAFELFTPGESLPNAFTLEYDKLYPYAQDAAFLEAWLGGKAADGMEIDALHAAAR